MRVDPSGPTRLHRFRRRQRLLTKADYRKVLEQQALYRDRHFAGYALYQHGSSRLGVIVSRKVSPLAVERNRLKRLVRESFRVRHKSANDIVVIAQSAARHESSAALRASLERLWQIVDKKCKPY